MTPGELLRGLCSGEFCPISLIGAKESRTKLSMKAISTLALVICFKDQSPSHLATISDEREISILDHAIQTKERNPLDKVIEHRELVAREEEEFGDFVEQLLSQPFQRTEIREHGLAWFQSRIRLEQFQKEETDAARVVAEYAYAVFQEDPRRRDFILDGAAAKIRIRIFEVQQQSNSQPFSSSAA